METLTTVIPTPLIDSALNELPASKRVGWRNPVYFARAVQTVAESIERKHIWNVDYEDARQRIRTAIEQALDEVSQQVHDCIRAHDKQHHTDRHTAMWDLVSSYIALNAAKGKAAKLRKKSADLIALYPALARYCAMLDEVVLLHEALEQLRPMIEKGRKPLENPQPVDLSNTGLCAICGNRQKMDKTRKMVHHGFRISDGYGNYLGIRSGSCFGVGYKPIELSCEANQAYRKVLTNKLPDAIKHLEELRAGKITTLGTQEWVKEQGIRVEKTVFYTVGDKQFPRLLERAVIDAEGRIRWIEKQIEWQTIAINTWQPKPLWDDLQKTERT